MWLQRQRRRVFAAVGGGVVIPGYGAGETTRERATAADAGNGQWSRTRAAPA